MANSAALPIVSIVGRPNVGKSTLFNAVVGWRRAIVAKEAGTTRDPVQDVVKVDSRAFWLIDTAGIETHAEQKHSAIPRPLAIDIQTQINRAIEVSDAILLILDGSKDFDQRDQQLIRKLLKSRKKVLIVVNKLDKTNSKIPPDFYKTGIKDITGVSAIKGLGVDELINKVKKTLPKRGTQQPATYNLAITGRPNVGKSSLFNVLGGEKTALTSQVAGTTIDAITKPVEYNGQHYAITDTGGIRRAGKRRGIESFSYLRTAAIINKADVAILVLDASEFLLKGDLRIAGIIKSAGTGLIIAINKWDLVEDPETMRSQIERRLSNKLAFGWWAPIIYISAASGKNVEKIWELALDIIKARTIIFEQQKLDEVLKSAISHQPPPGHPRPHLNQIKQSGTAPPEFTFIGNNLDRLHFSYRRYLESRLRKELNIMGTPIQIVFKKS